jgi:hypothetical protein
VERKLPREVAASRFMTISLALAALARRSCLTLATADLLHYKKPIGNP